MIAVILIITYFLPALYVARYGYVMIEESPKDASITIAAIVPIVNVVLAILIVRSFIDLKD